MTQVYCQECGFQNPEAANYCARCGAMLAKEAAGTDSTMTFDASELQGEEAGQALPELEGPALVVRSGGGRAGESFHPQGERTQIGRSPDCEIFLDDVTVSRKHAVLVNESGRFFIEDQGSLNGTFLNRKRIERAEISNGDEIQVGKYRLTFLAQ